MAEIRQKMRGTTAQNDTYIGPEGQITADIENMHLRLHDGITLGGVRQASEPWVLIKLEELVPTLSAIVPGFGIKVTGDWADSEIQIAIDPSETMGHYALEGVDDTAYNADVLAASGINGIFHTDSQLGVTSNWPGNRSGAILQSCLNDGGNLYATQLYMGDEVNELYYREMTSGAFGAWRRLMTGAPKTITPTSINAQDESGHTHALGFVPVELEQTTDPNAVNYVLGHFILAWSSVQGDLLNRNAIQIVRYATNTGTYWTNYTGTSGVLLSGTWRGRGNVLNTGGTGINATATLLQRVA